MIVTPLIVTPLIPDAQPKQSAEGVPWQKAQPIEEINVTPLISSIDQRVVLRFPKLTSSNPALNNQLIIADSKTALVVLEFIITI